MESDPSTDGLPMRVGVRNGDLSDERLRYVKQIGVDDVFVDQTTEEGPDRLPVAADNVPSVDRLVRTRDRLEQHGLRFAGIHSLSGTVYDRIMFGEEGAREQTEAIKRLLRNMGDAGVPILGYQWNPGARDVAHSTGRSTRSRGGAESRAFDLDEARASGESSADGTYDEAEFWNRFEGFLEEVLPVAEEAGVRMALHPADPPTVDALAGIPRLFRDVESFERAMEAYPSDYHGLKLCLGCFSEMSDCDVVEVIERFGERDEIVFVHFRDVVGTMPRFYETFVDEGNFDEYDAAQALRDVGFSGVLIPDHVPRVEGDTNWGHRSRGWSVGYIQGLLTALEKEREFEPPLRGGDR